MTDKMIFLIAEISEQVGRITDQDSDQVTVQDKTSVERLLSALGDDTLSAAELMERLSLSHRPTFRKNYLNPALEQSRIERTIPDKPNSKNQKYRKYTGWPQIAKTQNAIELRDPFLNCGPGRSPARCDM